MKKYLIVFIVLLVIGLLVYIFYPKNCGRWAVVPGADFTQCKCLGFKTIFDPGAGAGGRDCWGLAIWNK